MKRLKILQTQSDFETQYPDGIPSNDVVLVKENDKLYMATNNADGTYAEYGATGGGEITPEIIEELGLVTTNDISAFVKNGTAGNLYIGSGESTTGGSLVVVRQFQGQASETKLSNVDNRSALVNRVGGIDNARVILSHEGLMVSFSGDKDTSFPAQSKHVAYIEDTSVNFALKSDLDGFVDSQDISTFVTMNDVQAEGYLKPNDVSNYALRSELDGFVDSQDISTFITMSQVEGQGYLKQDDISIYATESYVNNSVSTFITENNVSIYATESYVNNSVSTFITENNVSLFATESYVNNSVSTFITENNVSTFITLSDVSNHALKSDLDYIVW